MRGGFDVRSARAVAVGLVAALLGACASAVEQPSIEDGGSPTPGTTATSTPTPGVATTEVGHEFWFAGFHISLGTATFDPAGEPGPTVIIEAMFENQGSLQAIFDGTPSLSSGGSFYDSSFAQELPNVPGLASGTGAFAFEVDGAFTFDDAVLTIGLAENNQAVIPLGGSGEAVTLEPGSLSVEGETKAGVIRLELTGGELRADIPERHGQIERGSLALTLDFDVSNLGSYAGGFAFTYGNNLALELPDGTTIAAEDGPIELLSLGTTLPGQHVRFTVPDPPEGTYALVLIDDTTDRRSAIPFEIARP